ncbi:MAG TPA: patatin-like phospholipase family protein [Alicyclobacillus sp.]|nr:patatin-like phospholipase family protein [Alicyclobacillus sp.]
MRRILSIDGGGIKGAFPASFLATIEEQIGDHVANYFDLIVGTSTGGIIALGLGLGFTAREIEKFYTDLGSKIFNKNQKPVAVSWKMKCAIKYFHRKISNIVSKEQLYELAASLSETKYDLSPLEEELKMLFRDRTIGDSKVRLVIPSFNLITGQVHVYKTRHHERFERDYNVPAFEAAIATAAAPIFFPIYRGTTGIPLIDGGIYANNPMGMAVVEAVSVLGWKPEELKVLSLGCTESPLDVNLDKKNLGLLDWNINLLHVFMRAQDSISNGIASLLANEHQNKNIVRINPSVPAGKYALDSIDRVNELIAMGESVARVQLPHLRELGFFDKQAEVFVPIPLKNKVNYGDHSSIE